MFVLTSHLVVSISTSRIYLTGWVVLSGNIISIGLSRDAGRYSDSGIHLSETSVGGSVGWTAESGVYGGGVGVIVTG